MTYDYLDQMTSVDRPVFFDVEKLNVQSGGGLFDAPDKRMLVRHTEDFGRREYMSIVNKTYEVVLNSDILLPFQKQLVNHFDPSVLEDMEIKDHVLKNGAVCYSEYILPKVSRPIETKTGHRTNLGLRWIMKNSFNGSSSVVLYGGLIDFFCTNGMITGKFDVMKQRHTKNFEVEGFYRAFEDTVHKHTLVMDKYQEYADKKVTSAVNVNLLFKKLVTPAVDTEVKSKRSNTLADRLFVQYAEEAAVRGHNVFSVLSALTNYASHGEQDGRFKVQKRADESALFKRQEQVAKWTNSRVWEDYLEVA